MFGWTYKLFRMDMVSLPFKFSYNFISLATPGNQSTFWAHWLAGRHHLYQQPFFVTLFLYHEVEQL